jgi:GntR family transcriptional regulator/MocR family aminotransferase
MLRPWKLSLASEPGANGELPLHVQIGRGLIRDIQRGRLMPGTFLPSSRELAASAGVNRKTVVAAYEELKAQGWLETTSTRGTRVAANLPERLPDMMEGQPGPGDRPDFAFTPGGVSFFVTPGPEMLTLDLGSPDCRLFPADTLARAYRDAVMRARRAGRLSYGDPRGSLALRESIAVMLGAQRGMVVRPEQVCVTRGSQMGVAVAAMALFRPGDVVVMEALSYTPAAQAFAAAGARIMTVGLDGQGIDVEAVEALCRQEKVRAIFVTPHHQFPTSVSLRPERRLRLLELARQFGFAIIEDDYDYEYHFESQPLLPIASHAPGRTLYIGSLSKLTLPSLRIGYVVAPTQVIDAIAGQIMNLDRQGNIISEEAVASLIDSGELRRHIRKTHAIYARRRRSFAAALHRHLADIADFAMPDGGLAYWVRFRDETMLDRIDAEAENLALSLAPSTSFAIAPSRDRGLRLGFASLNEQEAERALGRLRSITERVRPTPAEASADLQNDFGADGIIRRLGIAAKQKARAADLVQPDREPL